MKFKNKIYLEYDDVLSMCHNLEYDASKFRPELIVGITRGGLLPAVHLSHCLERPMMTLDWQTRDKNRQEHNETLRRELDKGTKVLFVDDINDTGRTFTEISKHYHCERDNVMFLTLVSKTQSYFKCKAALKLSDDRWIVFPWEKD